MSLTAGKLKSGYVFLGKRFDCSKVKDHVSREYKEHRSWPNKWGYLLDYYRKQLDPLEKKQKNSAGSTKSSAGTNNSAKAKEKVMQKENDKHSINLPPITGAPRTMGGNKIEEGGANAARKRAEKAVTFPSIVSPVPCGNKRTEGRKFSYPTDELEGRSSEGSKIKLPRISAGARGSEDREERFPETTAGEIGWKWRKAVKYGNNQQGVRRKKSMRKSFDWPRSFM